jgi:hypothetical protein
MVTEEGDTNSVCHNKNQRFLLQTKNICSQWRCLGMESVNERERERNPDLKVFKLSMPWQEC